MLEVRVLFGCAQTSTLIGLILVTVRVIVLLGGLLARLLVFCYPLRLALLVGGGFGIRFGFGLGGFGGLLTLYFAVFGGVPGVENLIS